MNKLSLYGGHDSNITIFNSVKDQFHIIELERIVKQRYFNLSLLKEEQIKKHFLTVYKLLKIIGV